MVFVLILFGIAAGYQMWRLIMKWKWNCKKCGGKLIEKGQPIRHGYWDENRMTIYYKCEDCGEETSYIV